MYPRRRFRLALPGGRTLALGERTLVMGVINVTPDSFSDGGDRFGPVAAVDAGGRVAGERAGPLGGGGGAARAGADPLGGGGGRARGFAGIEALAPRVAG